MGSLPRAAKVYFFSSSTIDGNDVHTAIMELCKLYPSLDISVFADLSVVTQTVVAFDSSRYVFLPRQEIEKIRSDLPQRGVGGAILDYYFNKNSNGKCQDQIIVFWDAKAAES